MASIAHLCPHCLTERAAFNGKQYLQKEVGSPIFNLLMRCNICGECIVAQFFDPSFPNWIEGLAPSANLIAVYPSPIAPRYPEHLPQNVLRFYEQADDALRRENWDSAGMMFRKALDTGLKSLDPNGRGTLQNRIDNLPESTGVTPAMKTWAHQIRRLGNDAAHEDDPFTKEEANDLQSYTELFLTYAFTLPGMLARRNPGIAGQVPTT